MSKQKRLYLVLLVLVSVGRRSILAGQGGGP